MPWSRKLKPPIPLKDGRTLVTLKDAAEGKQSAIAEVGLQLHRALNQSRLIGG